MMSSKGDVRPALVDVQRRRTVSTARIAGAIAGTPFFIAVQALRRPIRPRACSV
jgi:hypothetical protein